MLFLLRSYAEKNTRLCRDFDIVFASWFFCENKRVCKEFYDALAS